MKTREQIIMSMCLSTRHDYGLDKVDFSSSGMSLHERLELWGKMANIYGTYIAPYLGDIIE